MAFEASRTPACSWWPGQRLFTQHGIFTLLLPTFRLLPQELHRVLRPGCSVAILDFNNAADNPVVDATQVWRVGRLDARAAE